MAKKKKQKPIFRIGAVLAEQGGKQNALARVLGVNNGTVSEWINHKTYPETKKLPAIAEALNVNIRDLFIPTEPKPGKSKVQLEGTKEEELE